MRKTFYAAAVLMTALATPAPTYAQAGKDMQAIAELAACSMDVAALKVRLQYAQEDVEEQKRLRQYAKEREDKAARELGDALKKIVELHDRIALLETSAAAGDAAYEMQESSLKHLEQENRRLTAENASLAAERDMLRRAWGQ